MSDNDRYIVAKCRECGEGLNFTVEQTETIFTLVMDGPQCSCLHQGENTLTCICRDNLVVDNLIEQAKGVNSSLDALRRLF